ncbi:hypothetical protein FHS18_003850 [Paenibacillus phyllosphaerae]|uniref:Type I restriction modification DNA specificity domain-containing protein n=1 Tax=Paenibacillus phyllosphaerae TaxID=274593 RepID=A0A7W5B019_9BACL|nr:restriction endonuclease subunit S [Paenibacillus phyllosphaerae]MBB3111782.1 hypothetical protein [Paenibacillus phyllosphaerae]
MIETFWNICLLHDIGTRDQLLREAVRVIRTKQILEQSNPSNEDLTLDPEELFRWMKERVGERELGHFPGDRDLFYKLYHAGKDLDLLEYALQTLQQDRVTGGIIVYPGIVERFVDMCKRSNYKSLLITEVEKYLKGLIETKFFLEPFSITLLTESYIVGRLLKTYFDSSSNVTVIQGSIYQPLPLQEKYEAVLAIPNFGMKMTDEDDTTIRDAEGAAINNLVPLLQEGGTISATFPARMMFQSGAIANWRKQINDWLPVKSICLLPDGLFRPYTSIKTYQVEFSNSIGKEVLLGRSKVENTKLVTEKEITVYSDQFRTFEDWRIEMLIDEDQDVIRSFQQVVIPKVKLRDVAEIFRGKSILKQDLKPGTIKVLNISNIEDGKVVLDRLETIDEAERKIKRYEILPDDLVMTCRGTVTKLAVFPETNETVIASANIIVIRFKSTILSQYAKIFLESPTGSALIQSFQRGTTVMNLNPADVAEIEIPVLSQDQQLERINRYIQEEERYNTVVREATTRWEQVKNQIYSDLY